MMLDKIQVFEGSGGKLLYMVENIGTQLTMAHSEPTNMEKRKTVLGPDLFFDANGNPDTNPQHYFHPSMSTNPKAKPILRELTIKPDLSKV